MRENREVSPIKAAIVAAAINLCGGCAVDDYNPYPTDTSLSGDTATDTVDTIVDTAVDTTDDTAATDDLTECADGIDNDDNGVADADDTNCYGTDGNYDATRTTEQVQQCRDGADNDGDGLTDSNDKGQCPTGWYDLEAAECNDGVDNDMDGWMDAADAATGTVSPDPECANQYDTSETEAGAQYPDGLEDYYETLVNPPETADTGDTALLLQNAKDAVEKTWTKIIDLKVT